MAKVLFVCFHLFFFFFEGVFFFGGGGCDGVAKAVLSVIQCFNVLSSVQSLELKQALVASSLYIRFLLFEMYQKHFTK